MAGVAGLPLATSLFSYLRDTTLAARLIATAILPAIRGFGRTPVPTHLPCSA